MDPQDDRDDGRWEAAEAATRAEAPPDCHHEIPADAPMGLCPSCLLAGAIDAPRVSSRFGEYELLEKIDSGGMGVVHKARHVRTRHTVALKMILGGELASEAAVYRFHDEAEAASHLDHPNIVPIYHVGEHEGRHYFTMKLMRGGSLADDLERFRGDPRGTAELVATIAMAVHYGHQRGILHRDLKPANILLDGEGKPHVADFGVAKRVDTSGALTHPGVLVGTPSYMAPEQADPRTKTLTTAADVYSLGVILYELVTGKCPFEGKDTSEILEKVRKSPPADPRTIEPRVDRDLATICFRCLEKDPANRYRSAEDLALEIRRYLNGDPIGKVGRAERAWRWCRRRPFAAAIIAESALLLVIATVAALMGAAAQERDRREEVLRANEYAARWVAGTVLFKLNSYHDAVAEAARDFPPELFTSLRGTEIRQGDGMEAYCQELQDRHGELGGGRTPFNGWFILDKEGKARARWPRPNVRDYLQKNYAWRDYFKGAWKLALARSRSAYISRAIFSEASRTQRFAIAAPIYDEKAEPLGMIVAMADTGATLGTLELKDPSDKRHIAMVVAPRDNDRTSENAPLPNDHVILVHDSLEVGRTAILKSNAAVHEAVALAERSNPNRGLEQLLLAEPNAVTSDEGHCDPVMDGRCDEDPTKPHAGRWLAGFAPVGNTGFVAIVETPRDAAAQPNQTLARRLLLWGVLPFAFGTALLAGVLGAARRRGYRGISAG
jgi:serine/threonine-protein kinase